MEVEKYSMDAVESASFHVFQEGEASVESSIGKSTEASEELYLLPLVPPTSLDFPLPP